MRTIDSDNLVKDFINNAVAVVSDNMEKLGLRRIYDDDVTIIDSTPSLSISCNNIMKNRRTVGRRYRITFYLTGDLWYYDSMVSDESRKTSILAKAFAISKVYMENANLNGFLKNESIDLKNITYAQRIRGGIIYGGARILFIAPYLTNIVENRDD